MKLHQMTLNEAAAMLEGVLTKLTDATEGVFLEQDEAELLTQWLEAAGLIEKETQ